MFLEELKNEVIDELQKEFLQGFQTTPVGIPVESPAESPEQILE